MKFAEFVELVEEKTGIKDAEELAQAMVDCFHNVEWAESELANYIGNFDSFQDFADSQAIDQLSSVRGTVNDFMRNYFDYEKYAKDLEHDYTVLELHDGVAVFNS